MRGEAHAVPLTFDRWCLRPRWRTVR